MSDDRRLSVLAPATDVLDLDASRPSGPPRRLLRRSARAWFPSCARRWRSGRSRAAQRGLVSLAVSRLVFPHFSVNNDEPVYVFQARLLLDRHLTLPVTPDADFFRPWMSGPVGDRARDGLPAGVPRAAGRRPGRPRAACAPSLALLAAAARALVACGRQLTGRTGATGDSWPPAAGRRRPLFIIQSGLFLGYVLALDLELARGPARCCAGARSAAGSAGSRPAGAVLGVLFFARPFDARPRRRPPARRHVVAAAPAAPGACRRPPAGAGHPRRARLPPVLASLAYNAPVTGSPSGCRWRHRRDNGPGFGVRHLSAGTPDRALLLGSGPCGRRSATSVAARLGAGRRCCWWGWPPLGLPATGGAPGPGRWPPFAVTFPLGYLFYWGNLLIVRGRLDRAALLPGAAGPARRARLRPAGRARAGAGGPAAR